MRELVKNVLARKPPADVAKLTAECQKCADTLEAGLLGLAVPQALFTGAMKTRDDLLPEWHKDFKTLKIQAAAAWHAAPGTLAMVFAPPPLRERGAKPDDVEWRKRNCTAHNQFTLHANSYVAPLDRKGLEKMIRYLCRLALATERVELQEDDTMVRLRLKTPWRDGTTHIRMAAAEFVLRLLALIPAPHKKQIRYLGVFAANAKWRREVVLRPKSPKPKKEPCEHEECEHAEREAKADELKPGHKVSRLTWSQAMRRTFKLDVLNCDKCGGRREVIALIPSGEIATKILAHLKLPVDAQGFLPIRASPWDADFSQALAANDEIDRPFFDEDAA